MPQPIGHAISYVAIFVVVTLFVFNTRLTFLPSIGGSIFSVFLVLCCYIVITSSNIIAFNRKLFLYLLVFPLFGFYASLSAMLHGHEYIYFLSISFSIPISLLFGYMLAVVVSRMMQIKDVYLLDYLIKVAAYGVLLNSVIIIIGFYNPEFKDIIESSIFDSPNANINYEDHAFRLRGIAAAGGASLSVVTAFGVICFFHLAINRQIDHKLAIIFSLLLFFSNIFIGRTGLIGSGALIVCMICYFVVKKGSSSSLILNLSFLISISLLVYYSAFKFYEDFPVVFDWAFEWSGLKNEGPLRTESTSDLFDMFILPSNPAEVVFGLGFFEGYSSSVSRSDSGYIKTLLTLGLIFGSIFYLVIFRVLGIIVRTSGVRPILYVISVCFLTVVEIKEPFLYQNYLSRLLFMLAGISMYIISQKSMN